jgi:hypothetical protein
MKKAKVYFFIKRDKKNFEGKCGIYCMIVVNGENATIATGKYINPDRWDETNHLHSILKRIDEKNVQDTLKIMQGKIEKIITEFQKDESSMFNANSVKAKLFGKALPKIEGQRTVLDAIDFYNDYFQILVNWRFRANWASNSAEKCTTHSAVNWSPYSAANCAA